MKTILVTGGAGYIGSHTAKALARAGYQPVVLDDLSAGHRWAVRWGPLVEGNVDDEKLVRRVIETYKVDAVIHFAANSYVGESMRQPRKYFNNNVVSSLALLHAMMDAGVGRIVFSSTCAVYGIPHTLPIDETQAPAPVNPYGDSKLFVERALGWYGQAHQLESVCLRYFNAAGADPDREIGECHTPETHLLPLLVEAAQGRRRSVCIYGDDYPTDDGTAVRDYIHVSDLANAHVLAVEYLLNGGTSTTVNLGTGQGHSVRQAVKAVERISGRLVPAVIEARRPGDPAILVACSDLARQTLGWRPKFTNLDEIVDTAWAWHCRSSRLSVAAG